MWMKLDYGYVNYIQMCMKCTVNVRARLLCNVDTVKSVWCIRETQTLLFQFQSFKWDTEYCQIHCAPISNIISASNTNKITDILNSQHTTLSYQQHASN